MAQRGLPRKYNYDIINPFFEYLQSFKFQQVNLLLKKVGLRSA